MGLFGILSGALEAGVSVVLSPLAVATDMLEGDTSNTESCIVGAAKGTTKIVKGVVTTPIDPLGLDDDI